MKANGAKNKRKEEERNKTRKEGERKKKEWHANLNTSS